MNTITGKLEDTTGAPLHVHVTFTSRSTPIVESGSGTIFANSTIRTKTNATDGTFSVTLEAGVYDVAYATTPQATTFQITVPDGNSTLTIDTVTNTPLAFIYTAPNTVWNGTWPGAITFVPIDDYQTPEVAEVVYSGGHITGESYSYAVTHITPEGETGIVTSAYYTNITGSGASNRAMRVSLEVNPSRVTSKRIWRTYDYASGVMFLLADVSPSTPYYDDWESNTDFGNRATHPPNVPLFNTTAGIINSTVGFPILYCSTSGLNVVSQATFQRQVNMYVYPTLTMALTPSATNYGSIAWDGTSIVIGVTGTSYLQVSGSGLKIPVGASAGYVLTSDGSGNAAWAAASGSVSGGSIPIDGVTAAPVAPPSDPTKNTFYFSTLGTLYGWRASDTTWYQIVG